MSAFTKLRLVVFGLILSSCGDATGQGERALEVEREGLNKSRTQQGKRFVTGGSKGPEIVVKGLEDQPKGERGGALSASSAQEPSQPDELEALGEALGEVLGEALALKAERPELSSGDQEGEPRPEVKESAGPTTPKEVDEPKKPKKPKKPSKCKRGIHKGAKECKVKRFHINIRQINRGLRHKDLRIIGEDRNITKEGRKAMLKLLGDWRTKETCSYGYTFNFEYSGRASWKMYDCYVQDRLLWYLYLIGHHFDSEIQVLSGLRSEERKSSRHHNGHAVDFRVAGVKPKEVWEYCKKTFPLAGIGYYPKAKFVHLDVGRDHHQAYWVDSSGSGESARYKSGVSQVQKGRAKKSQAGMIKSIKGMLTRHYKSFKTQQSAWVERKKARERRKKKRARAKRRTKARRAKRKKR